MNYRQLAKGTKAVVPYQLPVNTGYGRDLNLENQLQFSFQYGSTRT